MEDLVRTGYTLGCIAIIGAGFAAYCKALEQREQRRKQQRIYEIRNDPEFRILFQDVERYVDELTEREGGQQHSELPYSSQ